MTKEMIGARRLLSMVRAELALDQHRQRFPGLYGRVNEAVKSMDEAATLAALKAVRSEMCGDACRVQYEGLCQGVDEAIAALAGEAAEAFCPTGPGGGIDPSCSPGGGRAPSFITTKKGQAVYARIMKEPEKVFGLFQQEKGGYSDAAKDAAKHIADKLVMAVKSPGDRAFATVAKAVRAARRWGAQDTVGRAAVASAFRDMGGSKEDADQMFSVLPWG